MEKSHVSLTICPICGDGVDVLLDRRLKKSLPPRVMAQNPCDKCKNDLEEYKKKGVVLLTISNDFEEGSSGSPWPYFKYLSVVKDEAAEKMFTGIDFKANKIMFLPEKIATQIGLKMPTD